MNLRKHRVSIAILALLIVALSATIVYMWPRESKPLNVANPLFPTGIPSALGTVSALQVGEQQINTISVTGSGTASMQADEATIVLGVQTEDKSASEAVRMNAEKMNRVIDAIKALGITEENMKTVSYSVYPVYSQTDYTTVIGYRVINMIAVETTDTSLIGKIIDAAADVGANQIQGVSFGLSEEKQSELKRQAYLAALADAEGKAKLIAEKLKLSITGVLYVGESSYQPYQPYWDYKYAAAGEVRAPTPILEGKLSVSVTVSVIYSFTQ
ncbi:MAG: SIMPL domain-containing protein [Candidatus Bathyarchaeia archaeon]